MGNTQRVRGFPVHIYAWSFLLSACSKRTVQLLQSVSMPGHMLITQSKYLRLGVVFLKTLDKFMVRCICCEYHTEPFHCLRRVCILAVYFFLSLPQDFGSHLSIYICIHHCQSLEATQASCVI